MEVSFRALDVNRDWAWVKARIPVHLMEDTKGIIAEADGEIIGACVADSWTHTSVMIHQAIDRPMLLRHRWLEEIAFWVFVVGRRKVMYALVPSDNDKAYKLDLNIGFKELIRLKEAAMDGVDLILMELRREDCRWLPEEYRHEQARSTASA